MNPYGVPTVWTRDEGDMVVTTYFDAEHLVPTDTKTKKWKGKYKGRDVIEIPQKKVKVGEVENLVALTEKEYDDIVAARPKVEEKQMGGLAE